MRRRLNRVWKIACVSRCGDTITRVPRDSRPGWLQVCDIINARYFAGRRFLCENRVCVCTFRLVRMSFAGACERERERERGTRKKIFKNLRAQRQKRAAADPAKSFYFRRGTTTTPRRGRGPLLFGENATISRRRTREQRKTNEIPTRGVFSTKPSSTANILGFWIRDDVMYCKDTPNRDESENVFNFLLGHFLPPPDTKM